MKISKASILFVAFTSLTDASGNLRAATEVVADATRETTSSGSLHMKANPLDRALEGDTRMANILDVSESDIEALEERKGEATRQKYEKMNPPNEDTPSYEIKVKGPTDADGNTDFGINIVGGELSDAGEFPYYGKSLFRFN
jgi:hypothetical protein